MRNADVAVHTAIVVVTYNGERYLDDLFASVRAHTDVGPSGRTALIVVDNASTDGTVAKLRQLHRSSLVGVGQSAGLRERGLDICARLGDACRHRGLLRNRVSATRLSPGMG